MSAQSCVVCAPVGGPQAEAALDAIDQRNARKPRCVVCQQPCNRLDKFGCCSKITDVHKAHRGEMKAQVRK